MSRRRDAVVLAGLLFAVAVSAQGAVPTAPSMAVETTPANAVRAAIQVYAVDFNSADDVASFYGILRSAAQTVCTGAETTADPTPTSSRFSCIDLLVADSVQAINKPRLTALARQTDPAVQALSGQAGSAQAGSAQTGSVQMRARTGRPATPYSPK